MKEFWLCFVLFFVAVDAIGLLTIYLGLTEETNSVQKKRIIIKSLITAFVVAVVFLVCGPAILSLVGVSVSDFMVAGGILLLLISLTDIITGEKRQRMVDPDTIGAVPIGVPLITGPAVLTTSILLANEYGLLPTSLSLLANIIIIGIVFLLADPISRILGNAGSKTLSKVASLFLASIAVMLIRKGITEIIQQGIK